MCIRDRAKEELEEAKKELNLGDGDISIQLSCNSDGDHEAIMQLIQADLKAIGVEATIDTAEWAAYLTKLQDLDYQVGRLGWIADYPIMDNFLYPLFYTCLLYTSQATNAAQLPGLTEPP